MGQILPAVGMPGGAPGPESADGSLAVEPDWVDDPFIACGVASDLPARPRLLADEYLIVHTQDESAHKLGRWLGADIIASRRCLLKGRLATRRSTRRVVARQIDCVPRKRNCCDVSPAPCPCQLLYDLIEDGEDVFLAMEDVKGETLSDYVQRLAGDGRLVSTADVVACGMDLTALLGAIHDQGVVHSDLKSNNVVVGINRRLWLVDFEFVAHDLNWQVVPDGRGTEGYMWPSSEGSVPTVLEQGSGLGAILYFPCDGCRAVVGACGR